MCLTVLNFLFGKTKHRMFNLLKIAQKEAAKQGFKTIILNSRAYAIKEYFMLNYTCSIQSNKYLVAFMKHSQNLTTDKA